MVDAIVGVLLNPWYAAAMVTIMDAIRFSLGTGCIFAFPEGIPRDLIVGLLRKYLIKSNYAALTEPIRTGLIGALLSAPLVGPLAVQAEIIANFLTLDVYVIYFSASNISVSILGFIVLKAIRRSGFIFPEKRQVRTPSAKFLRNIRYLRL